ncbi:hypothetical protein C8J57DRAFT_1708820 [Mycena rebaudengoi]|nr:hypothetical protein C8J57DRAFT_1708820 [Mycena rebaudengoi]
MVIRPLVAPNTKDLCMAAGPSKGRTVTISADGLVDLAKSALVSHRCEATLFADHEGGASVVCGRELACWKSLYKHQLKHCSTRRGPNGSVNYMCRLPKCSAKMHASLKALSSHVELSHMKNVALPCPFANCKPVIPEFGRPPTFTSFFRPRDLITHVEYIHGEHIGSELDVRSTDVLLPNWEPRRPARPLLKPPPLPPSAEFRSAVLLGTPVKVPRAPCFTSASTGDTFPPLSQTLHAPHTPTRRRMLRPGGDEPPSSPPGSEPQFDIADIPMVRYDEEIGLMHPPDAIAPPYLVVQRVDEGFPEYVDLARPVPLSEVPVPEMPPPPPSIFYEVLAKEVYASYAAGEGAANDPSSSSVGIL